MADPVSAAALRLAQIRARMEYEITMAAFVITAHPDGDVEAVLHDVVESALKQCEAALARAEQTIRETATLETIARQFIAYYAKRDDHGGGCSNCGGQPHTDTCFVGRFDAALSPRARPATGAPETSPTASRETKG